MKFQKAGLLFTWVWLAAGCRDTAELTPVGSLSVSVASSGPSLDKDGYRLSINGDPGSPVATTGQVRIPSLSVGSHQLELTGLAINCTVTGGNPRTVTVYRGDETTETFAVTCPLALDGHLVYYRAETVGHGSWGEIYVSLPDGSGEVPLTGDDGMVNNIMPEVSPNATLIAYVSNSVVTVMAPDASAKQPLPSPPGVVYSPHWSPDGSRIVVSVQNLTSGWDIYVVHLDGSGFTPVTQENFLYAAALSWSSDGTEVSISAQVSDSTPNALLIAKADGSGWREVPFTPATVYPLDESPDGERIIFLRQQDSTGNYARALFSVNRDGSGLQQLTPDSLSPNANAAYSPDGTRIAFTEATTLGQIFVMNEDGSGLGPIGVPGGEGLGWTPDGRLSFRDYVPGTADYDIFAVNPDGSNLQNLTRTSSQEVTWDWAPIR